jgi:hypothetical protein
MDEHVELELELAADGQDGYRVTVRSAAGDDFGRLLLDPVALLGQRRLLQSTVLASAVTPRGAMSEVEAPVREIGEALFHALFDEGVYAAYKASLALAAAQGTQLRVVLRTQAPELAALPWETMYDPGVGAYLCQREPLVRHVSVSSVTQPLRVTPPLRILGVVAAPRDQQRLDVDGEKQRLRAALKPLGSRVSLRWVEGGRWADVQRELIEEHWHVLHFVGHGGFDEDRREGMLALENSEGGTDLVGADRFSDLLTLQQPPLQLVLLNSCSGAQAAAADVFSSTAASLVRTGVSAVVAMQFAVSDPAAKAFAAGFYQAIAHNRSIAEAVRIGRIGIRGTSEKTLEWITPVLYLRGDDAALFEVERGADDGSGAGSELSPEDAAREAAVPALYQQAMSKFRAGDFAGALGLFDNLLSDRDDFRDAASRRERAAHEVRVAETYDEARDAEDDGDWSAAVEAYAAVLRLDPHHPHAEARLDRCRTRQQVASLQEELRAHAAAEDWPAAVAVADELHLVSPADSDPDGLASLARSRTGDAEREQQRLAEEEAARERQRLAEEAETERLAQEAEKERLAELQAARERQRLADKKERERLAEEAERQRLAAEEAERQRREEERRRRRRAILRYVVAPAAVLLLIGSAVAVFWPDDGGNGGSAGDGGTTREEDAPAPFESVALWNMASPFFEPGECRVPESPDEAPLAWDLPHTELLKCTQSDESYSGTFLCAADESDFETIREAFLGEAIGDTEEVTDPPAGRDEPYPFQVAFHHDGVGAGRVFWDDVGALCSAELQTTETDLEVVLGYWVGG